MAKTYIEVLAQIEALKAQADNLRQQEVEGVIARIKDAIDQFGLTFEDLGLAPPRRRGRGTGAPKPAKAATAAKFGDGQGNVWGGRGPRPAWLRAALTEGHSLEEFSVGAARAPKRGAATEPQVEDAPKPKRAAAKKAVKAVKAAGKAASKAAPAKRAARRPTKPAAVETPAQVVAEPTGEAASQE